MAKHRGAHPHPDPNADASDLIPLPEFGTASETAVVVGLLESNGIPVVRQSAYNPKARERVLVPQNRWEEARQLIASGRSSGSPSAQASPDAPQESPSMVTAIGWILAIGLAAYVIFEVGNVIYNLARHWLE
jgi:hypothetical protein